MSASCKLNLELTSKRVYVGNHHRGNLITVDITYLREVDTTICDLLNRSHTVRNNFYLEKTGLNTCSLGRKLSVFILKSLLL